MKSAASEELNDRLKDILLDDEYSYILIKYDHSIVTFDQLAGTIEIAGSQILDTIVFEEKPEGNRSILIKLDSRDIKHVVYHLLKHPLIYIKGYNAKVRTTEIVEK